MRLVATWSSPKQRPSASRIDRKGFLNAGQKFPLVRLTTIAPVLQWVSQGFSFLFSQNGSALARWPFFFSSWSIPVLAWRRSPSFTRDNPRWHLSFAEPAFHFASFWQGETANRVFKNVYIDSGLIGTLRASCSSQFSCAMDTYTGVQNAGIIRK